MQDMSKAEELQLRSRVMEASVDLLNAFGAYLHAESNSPEEDQLEAAMDDRVTTLMKGGVNGLAGHVMLCLVAMLHNTADPDQVQEWLNDQSEQMLRQAAEINAGD
jgi:hypothetical protein